MEAVGWVRIGAAFRAPSLKLPPNPRPDLTDAPPPSPRPVFRATAGFRATNPDVNEGLITATDEEDTGVVGVGELSRCSRDCILLVGNTLVVPSCVYLRRPTSSCCRRVVGTLATNDDGAFVIGAVVGSDDAAAVVVIGCGEPGSSPCFALALLDSDSGFFKEEEEGTKD